MLMLILSVKPVKFRMFAPNVELLPEIVVWVTVVGPKLMIAPPPLLPPVLPVNVLLLMLSVVSLSMAPPPGPVLPLKVLPVTVIVPAAFSRAPPPKIVAVLPVKVSLGNVAVSGLTPAPPSCAVLPVNVLVDRFSVPLLLMPPPDVPVDAGAESPVNVLPVTVSVPWLNTPPPPCCPLLARPLLMVTEFSVRLPAEATSKMRNVGVPAAVDLAIVAPLPWIVTFLVITGRPTPPPSVVLLIVVSV